MTPLARIRMLGSRLSDYGGPGEDPSPRPGGFTASVAVLLRPGGDAPEILLIRRPESERDPWSGHMAFPGGRRDPNDRSLLETAVRETFEETGIPLGEQGELLGRLEAVQPLSTLLPPLSIVPFVFAVAPGFPLRTSPAEVASAHWIPLPHFLDAASRTSYRMAAEAGTLTFPAYHTEGGVVWGLTHRILEDLLRRLV